MKRETFVSIMSTLMTEADDELLREAEGLVFWRKRELRQEKVQQYRPGERIVYLARDGKTEKQGTIDHLNKFSVSIKHADAHEGFEPEVVQIERVLGLAIRTLDSTVLDAEAAKNLMPEDEWQRRNQNEFPLRRDEQGLDERLRDAVISPEHGVDR